MNWIETNLINRKKDPNIDFQININKSKFERISFDQAANNTINQIVSSTTKNIFVAFSGGYDSEFIVRRLHSLKIDFTPIIVQTETGLGSERDYAYKTLRDLKIDAKILKLSNKEYVKLYHEKIIKELNGFIWPSADLYACEYAKTENGIIINGFHIGGFNGIPLEAHYMDMENKVLESMKNNHSLMREQKYFLKEDMFYSSMLYQDLPAHSLFLHNPQIILSMIDEVRDTDLTWGDYKERVYRLSYRPKIREKFDEKMLFVLNKIKDSLYKPNNIVYFDTKEQLIDLILEK